MSSLCYCETRSKLIHDSFTAETQDHEDHTFCGMMFDVKVNAMSHVPVESFILDEIWVRGGLGPIKIYWTEDTWRGKQTEPEKWKQIYEKTHTESYEELIRMPFTEPVMMGLGSSVGLYVHSSARNDRSIVYDNQRGNGLHQDTFITVLPGAAHLYFRPFENLSPWGGSGWRDRRQFVGKVGYAVRYKLWSPVISQNFPIEFRKAAASFVNVHIFSWKGLPLDVVIYILNMLHPCWFSKESIQSLRRQESTRPALSSILPSLTTTSLFTALTTTTTTTTVQDNEQLVVVRVLARWCSRCTIS